MGHYNQIVFSGFKEKSIENISEKLEEIFDKFSIKYSVYENPIHPKIQKKYLDLVWKYDKEQTDSPFGELVCYIGLKNKSYHVIIGDSSTFRINQSEETFEKFCDLCQGIAEVLDVKCAIYSEEPTSSELFIPSYINRVWDILELHDNYKMCGLVIIHKSEIEQSKAKKLMPLNGKLTLTDSGFYIYKML